MGGMRGGGVQDAVALAEIELCGELMIVASTAAGERLSFAVIDEVLRVREDPGAGRRGVLGRGVAGPAPGPPGGYPHRAGCQVRSMRAMALVASSTLASISSPPLRAASATQWRRCSSRSWRAKDWRPLVLAETCVSMSMQ